MKFLVISDSHGGYKETDLQGEQIDAVLLLGDIDYYEVRKIDEAFHGPKFGVLGNHDGPDYFEGTGIVNLHGKVIEFKGLTIGGFEGCPRYNKRAFGQYEDGQVKAFIESFSHLDILISHANPMQDIKADETDPHRGFADFTDALMDGKVDHLIHGHLHQAITYGLGEGIVHSVYPTSIIEII
jgi:Icc-related predicted phosphoesterase